MIQPINYSQSQAFRGSGITNFVKNQWQHICVQSLGWTVAPQIVPMNSPRDIISAKIYMDLGEYFSIIMSGKEATHSRQFSNIFSNLSDCIKDVIRFVKDRM